MAKKIILLTVFAVVSVLQGMSSETTAPEKCDQHIRYIEEGTTWEVEMKSNVDPESPAVSLTQSLEGSEIINDKEYLKLWLSIDGGEKELVSYIRISKVFQCVYALPVNNPDGEERLIYFYSKPAEEPKKLTPMKWDGTLVDESFNWKEGVGNDPSFTYNDIPYWYKHVDIFPEGADSSDSDKKLSSVKWIYGIGSIAGFTNQCYSLFPEVTTTLKRVVTGCSGVVYEAGTNGISEITEDAVEGGIKYRPDGTRFGDNEKGLYIQNGKKYIAR